MSRYKRIIGRRLRTRSLAAQQAELTAVLVVPVLAAGLVLLPALARAAAPITLVASGLALVLSIRIAGASVQSGPLTGLAGLLECDPLSALVLLLVAFVGTTAAAVVLTGYLGARGHHDHRRNGRRYYSLYNLFLLSMLAVPIIAHVALMWIAVSSATLLSAFLVGYEDTPGGHCQTKIGLSLSGSIRSLCRCAIRSAASTARPR